MKTMSFVPKSINRWLHQHTVLVVLGGLVILMTAAALVLWLVPMQGRDAPGDNTDAFYQVTRVIDGDTIQLANGWRVRYIGIDTPEVHEPKKSSQCYSQQATKYNQQLVGGQQVRLVADVSDEDKYGRKLRYVYTRDGTLVNMQLVRQGYARVLTIPPDTSLQAVFVAAQDRAQAQQLGLWSACS